MSQLSIRRTLAKTPFSILHIIKEAIVSCDAKQNQVKVMSDIQEFGCKISKSSVVLIIIVSDLRNRMALSDFENSKYFTSYGQFKLKFS